MDKISITRDQLNYLLEKIMDEPIYFSNPNNRKLYTDPTIMLLDTLQMEQDNDGPYDRRDEAIKLLESLTK